MKNMLILTLIGAIILSCSSDDDNQDDISHQIIGDWKLLETKIYTHESEYSIDHRHKNIIYSFQANGTLIVSGVSGEGDGGTPNGEYPYFFGYGHLGSSSDPQSLIVKIDRGKWTYNLTNGIMTLGLSYVDGPNKVFERVKGRE